MKASLRTSLATLFGSVALLVAPAAFAAGEPCFNDTDCPGGGAVCGGDVCNWSVAHPDAATNTAMPYTCNPAGTQPKGSDGWCSNTTTHEHCKCKAEGAKCTGIYCSFTKASDAPPMTGGTGGGGTGAGGMATAGTGGTGMAGTGTTAAPPPEEGGCSVSAAGRTSTGVALGLGLLGLGVAFARRRR